MRLLTAKTVRRKRAELREVLMRMLTRHAEEAGIRARQLRQLQARCPHEAIRKCTDPYSSAAWCEDCDAEIPKSVAEARRGREGAR